MLFRYNIKPLVYFLSCFCAFFSCEPLDVVFSDDIDEDMESSAATVADNQKTIDYPIVEEGDPAIECMIKKAQQMAYIQWNPLLDIPGLSSPIPAGVTRVGLPYSSVKEKDKFIGQEVSFYTFMTALHNPRSVLYTDDTKLPPYHGSNCGPYYGTVCSMAVNYALGLERPYESSMYKDLPFIAKVKQQDSNSLYPGDLLWSPGHVVLVLGIDKNEGNTQSVTIFESNGRTIIKNLSVEAFKERWNKVGWVAYRYLGLGDNTNYIPIPYYHNDNDPDLEPLYNSSLCTSRGDQVTYREGEDVVINLFSTAYTKLLLFRNEAFYQSFTIHGSDITLSQLPYGHYRAYLEDQQAVSDEISFEVINAFVHLQKRRVVYFSSFNAIPEYYVICDQMGNRLLIQDISEVDRQNGSFAMESDFSGYYLKVFFKGSFGRVSNEPILL